MSTETMPPLVVALKGEEVIARTDTGDALPVKVRLMPLRHSSRLATLMETEAELIEFVCVSPDPATPLPEGWVDNLSEESFDLLVRKARSINFPRFAAWAKRQAELLRDFVPLVKSTPILPTSSPTAS